MDAVVTPKEAAARLKAAGYRVREPKPGPLPEPMRVPGWSEAWKHRNCCEECDAAREAVKSHRFGVYAEDEFDGVAL